MKVIAKFSCEEITENKAGFRVNLLPVMNGSKENIEFYKYTPGGNISLSLLQPETAANFEIQLKIYDSL